MFEVVEGPAHDAGEGGPHHGARAGHLAHPRGPEVDILRAGVELTVGLQQGLERLHLHRAAEPHPHCLVPHDAVHTVGLSPGHYKFLLLGLGCPNITMMYLFRIMNIAEMLL